MYCTIDKQALRVVHVHPDYWVCSALADIEMPHVHTSVQPGDCPEAFVGYTDAELRLLITHGTGRQPSPYTPRNTLKQALAAMVSLMPVTDCVPAEVMAQRIIAAASTAPYRYVKGSHKPAQVTPGLFDLPRPMVPGVPTVESLALRPVQPAQAAAATTPAPRPPAPPAAPAAARQPAPAARPPSAPGTGSVTERIFALCDATFAQMWPEPGPMGNNPDVHKQRLDAVRKAAIPQLEAAGINLNSARKGSSMWVQARNTL